MPASPICKALCWAACLAWPPVSSSLAHRDFLVTGTGLAEGKGLRVEEWTLKVKGKTLGVALEAGQEKTSVAVTNGCNSWYNFFHVREIGICKRAR